MRARNKILLFCLTAFQCAPALAVSALENPQPWSFHSGIGVISGWSCEGPAIGVSIDGALPLNVPYGSARVDTAGVCASGSINTGFGLLLNFNRLGAGSHTAQLFVNGIAQGSPVSFRVTVPAGEFARGLAASFTIADFPLDGRSTTLVWQEALQNFAIVDSGARVEEAAAPKAGAPASLENPQPGSFQSGIGVISGWSCEGPGIGVSIDGAAPLNVPYGSARVDTAEVCGPGNTNTGFGLLLNFNRLGAGNHTARLFVNGLAQAAPISFRVTIPNGEFATGLSRQMTLAGFPAAGKTTTLTWQQALQNFAIAESGAPLSSAASLARQCAVPRPPDATDPSTNRLYGDTQGSLATELAWIRSFVNETYLWYQDVPIVEASRYVIDAVVPYVNPTNNASSSVLLGTNVDATNAYFNSQRSPLATASGRPKDQFHFTYATPDWVALSTAGISAGFGFHAAVLAPAPPRLVRVAYTDPGSPAALAGIDRGARFVSVNGIDVTRGGNTAVLNEGLFSPVAGRSYTFEIVDNNAASSRLVTLTAGTVTIAPVTTVGTFPAPYDGVGYIHFTNHIATAEAALIDAVNQLKAANGGAGVTDLVLDLRYNGGGFLAIASELAFMVAGASTTAGRTFERQIYNDKNPFGLTPAQANTPFLDHAVGFSIANGTQLPQLNLSRLYVITSSSTCSASESIVNGLRGIGIPVILIGGTTCGKPYGFRATDNCGTTYFTVQFKGANEAGYGDYADGFAPSCFVADDFNYPLGDPQEARIATTLRHRATGTCGAPVLKAGTIADPLLPRPAAHENRFLTVIPPPPARR